MQIEKFPKFLNRLVQFFMVQTAFDFDAVDLIMNSIAEDEHVIFLGVVSPKNFGTVYDIVSVKSLPQDFVNRFEGQSFRERSKLVAQVSNLPAHLADGLFRQFVRGGSLGL